MVILKELRDDMNSQYAEQISLEQKCLIFFRRHAFKSIGFVLVLLFLTKLSNKCSHLYECLICEL